jgi:hypothetical protein
MPQDLESLRAEMQAFLEGCGLAIFYGSHRMLDPLAPVSWDTERYPDYRAFVATAEKAGVKLLVFHQQAFSLDQIDAALDQLEECDFTREEKRQYENRLRQLQAYEGFTSALELSFTLESRIYMYETHTDWYESFTDVLGELEAAAEEQEAAGDDGSLGGYFSNN